MDFRVPRPALANTMPAALFLLYCCNITGTVATNNTEAAPKFGFVGEPDGRGTMSLIWSCLFTCFICLWSVVHPNIPATNESKSTLYKRRTGLLLLGGIAPEFIVTMSFTQWRSAHEFFDDITKLQRRWNMPLMKVLTDQDEIKNV